MCPPRAEGSPGQACFHFQQARPTLSTLPPSLTRTCPTRRLTVATAAAVLPSIHRTRRTTPTILTATCLVILAGKSPIQWKPGRNAVDRAIAPQVCNGQGPLRKPARPARRSRYGRAAPGSRPDARPGPLWLVMGRRPSVTGPAVSPAAGISGRAMVVPLCAAANALRTVRVLASGCADR